MVQFDPPSPVAVLPSLNRTGTRLPIALPAASADGRSVLLTVTLACDTPPFWRSTLNVPVEPEAPCRTHSSTASITSALVTVNVADVTDALLAKDSSVLRFRTRARAPV